MEVKIYSPLSRVDTLVVVYIFIFPNMWHLQECFSLNVYEIIFLNNQGCFDSLDIEHAQNKGYFKLWIRAVTMKLWGPWKLIWRCSCGNLDYSILNKIWYSTFKGNALLQSFDCFMMIEINNLNDVLPKSPNVIHSGQSHFTQTFLMQHFTKNIKIKKLKILNWIACIGRFVLNMKIIWCPTVLKKCVQ